MTNLSPQPKQDTKLCAVLWKNKGEILLTKQLKRVGTKQNAPLEGWQTERIEAGLADVKGARVITADALFARIAEKNGWTTPP